MGKEILSNQEEKNQTQVNAEDLEVESKSKIFTHGVRDSCIHMLESTNDVTISGSLNANNQNTSDTEETSSLDAPQKNCIENKNNGKRLKNILNRKEEKKLTNVNLKDLEVGSRSRILTNECRNFQNTSD